MFECQKSNYNAIPSLLNALALLSIGLLAVVAMAAADDNSDNANFIRLNVSSLLKAGDEVTMVINNITVAHVCSVSQVWNDSDTWCCQPTCVDPSGANQCTELCLPGGGCTCDQEFGNVLARDGISCIPTDKCDTCTDKENEVWNACGTLCEPSCANPNPRFCPAIQCTGFDGCRCSPGFLRLSTGGPCVSPDQCNNTGS